MYGLTTLYTGLSPVRLASVIGYSWACHEMPGAFAEFGVMCGGSLDMLAGLHPTRKIYGIDGFEGLPAPGKEDLHIKGEFALTEQDWRSLKYRFDNTHTKAKILKGYSPEVFKLIPEDETFSFVHIDTDLYSSIKDALDYFYPRLIENGILLFDDYGFNTTPGAKKAIDEWNHPCQFRGEVELTGRAKTMQYVIRK
jgi:O-methyltransferase